ncbi:MAG: very short patch repair endonuclease [Anaerolineales bacterium]|nr:very short patch repair endonuclease [Anaerolineales bacterium]
MDNLTKAQRRKNMQNIRSTGTLPERAVMQALRREKIYFAGNVRTLPGKPDIVFRRRRIVVFIDSDFWHGHPTRFTRPADNRDYWDAKIARNKARDKAVNRELKKLGWRVLRFWAYDIKHHPNRVLNRILAALAEADRLKGDV